MTDRTFDRYPPALRIACPSCNAQPAQPCRSRKARLTAPHPSRVNRATEGPRQKRRN